MRAPATRWRILDVPELGPHLSIELTVDTTAAAVVEAIEQAARRERIVLERIATTPPPCPGPRQLEDEFGHGLGEIDGGGE